MKKKSAVRAALASTAIPVATLAALLVPATAHADDAFSPCGNATWVNQNTTCPFAHNVTDAWFASPGNQIGAWSPALGRYVIMDCAYVNTGYVTGEVCRGGNNAVVVFHP
jgi:hypothetical protein